MMDATEKRAREIIASEYRKAGDYLTAKQAESGWEKSSNPLIHSVIAALTPPEGYILVPVKMTKEIEDVLNESVEFDYSAESTWDLAIHASGNFENVND